MSEKATTEKVLLAVVLVAVFVVVSAVGSGLVFRTYRNTTASMEPALPREAHIVAVRAGAVARQDIVTFRYPATAGRVFAKRVVALAGDTVELRDKRLFINGKEVDEPYVVHEDPEIYPASALVPEPYRSRDRVGPLRVPPGQAFVLGDNRDRSFDSRYFGTIPREAILGKVVLVFTWRRGFWRPE